SDERGDQLREGKDVCRFGEPRDSVIKPHFNNPSTNVSPTMQRDHRTTQAKCSRMRDRFAGAKGQFVCCSSSVVGFWR
ncbi:MAG: hypothetical protein QNK42_08230, partial [Pseudodonghicola sp.]|nr:hypothetical protein [Pseudodonghicola sp.]